MTGMIWPRIGGVLLAVLSAFDGYAFESPSTASAAMETPNGGPVISRLKPANADGRGYRLEYTIEAPIGVTWEFKTDFDSQILLTNKLIKSHRLVSLEGNVAITETVYHDKPRVKFRWQTSLYPERRLLEYVLLNPDECGQVYHRGSIQLDAAGQGTRVTQVAYFDFFGVSIWVNYPFSGGMRQFLEYTATWEQQAVLAYWRQGE